MILTFKKLDHNNPEHLRYTYGLLEHRYSLPNTTVSKQKLPSYNKHVENLKKYFIDYRIIYHKDIRLGIVALNIDGSLTHNYDYNSIKKHIKHIVRKPFEVSYTIISQYISLMGIRKCHVKINPKNQKALTSFIKMIDENKTGALYIDNIQLNIKHESH